MKASASQVKDFLKRVRALKAALPNHTGESIAILLGMTDRKLRSYLTGECRPSQETIDTAIQLAIDECARANDLAAALETFYSR